MELMAPQVQRHYHGKARAIERNKALKPDRVIKVNVSDFPNMVDAIFDGDHEMPGWVIMAANGKGRDLINGLFPQGHIEWRFAPDFPAGWLGFKINLPDVASATETKLPLDVIPAGRTIDNCEPDQLALILAFGVRRAGGRAAIVRRDNEAMEIEIFIPQRH